MHDCPEAFSRNFNTLMVGGIDGTFSAVDPVQKRVRFDLRPVQVVFSRGEAHMVFGTGQMLNQGPAESNIQQLMAPADAEHRPACCQKPLQHFELERIQVVIHRFLGDPVFTVTGRIDIAASRQQQAVIF